MNVNWCKIVLCLFIVSIVGACTSVPFEELVTAANKLANTAKMQPSVISAGQFTLLSYSKITDSIKPVTLYIEGDGKAWVTRTRWSLNPTPHNPIALQLATNDQHSANIIYLARPCQYRSNDTVCTPEYWTKKRYSEEVVVGMNDAINKLIQHHKLTLIDLVGFSGGATLAVLVAARRTDVRSVRTVAGNLDIDTFVDIHKVSPMKGSLNPISIANQLNTIPQLHFVGELDRTVPKIIIQSYVNKMQNLECVDIVDVKKVSHTKGWVTKWPELLRLSFSCSLE